MSEKYEYRLLHWSGRDLTHTNQVHIAGTTTYHNLQIIRDWVAERLDIIVGLIEQAVEAQQALDKVVTDWIIVPVEAVKVIYLDDVLYSTHEGFVYAGTNEPALFESKLRLVIDRDGATIWEEAQDHHTFSIELLEKPYYEEGDDGTEI